MIVARHMLVHSGVPHPPARRPTLLRRTLLRLARKLRRAFHPADDGRVRDRSRAPLEPRLETRAASPTPLHRRPS